MKPDEELFNRFKVLVTDIMNTASVVQNDHDRLIEDGYLTYDDFSKSYYEFVKRMVEHQNELDYLSDAVTKRLIAVADKIV